MRRSDLMCSVIGPLIGGFLSNEDNIQTIIQHVPMFHEYHYLFPLLITASLFVLSVLFIVFFCKETLPKMNRLASHTSELAAWGSQSCDMNKSTELDLKEGLLSNDMKRRVPSSCSVLMEKDSLLLISAYSTMNAFRSLPLAIINLVLLSFSTVYSVAVTNPHEMGGFELNGEGVSTIASSVAPVQLLVGRN